MGRRDLLLILCGLFGERVGVTMDGHTTPPMLVTVTSLDRILLAHVSTVDAGSMTLILVPGFD